MLGAEFVDCVRYILNGDETDGELAIGIDSGKRIFVRITTARLQFRHAEIRKLNKGSRLELLIEIFNISSSLRCRTKSDSRTEYELRRNLAAAVILGSQLRIEDSSIVLDYFAASGIGIAVDVFGCECIYRATGIALAFIQLSNYLMYPSVLLKVNAH